MSTLKIPAMASVGINETPSRCRTVAVVVVVLVGAALAAGVDRTSDNVAAVQEWLAVRMTAYFRHSRLVTVMLSPAATTALP